MFIAGSSGAQAQSKGRFVLFGDSLSDTTNLFTLRGWPSGGGYWNGRPTNGPVWNERFMGGAQTWATFNGQNSDNVNFAFSGARTTEDGPYMGSVDMPVQIQGFFDKGGVLSAKDTVIIWMGANNFHYNVAEPADVVSVMTGAANDVKNAIADLSTRGTRNFVVLNLPDLGVTPVTSPTPLRDAGTQAALLFKQQLAANMAQLKAADPSLNIIQVDVNTAFDYMRAHPGAFGLTNITDPCNATAACRDAPTAEQNKYLFWDIVHPNTAVHGYIAQLALQYIEWQSRGAGLARLTDSALSTRSEAYGRVFSRFDEVRRGEKRADGPYVELLGSRVSAPTGERAAGFAQTAAGLAIGTHAQISPDTAFVVEGFFQGGALKAGAYKGDVLVAGFDTALAWSRSNYFLRAGAGVNVSSFQDLTRDLLGPLQNRADQAGIAGNVMLEAGYVHQMGALSISPRARFGWLGSQFQAMQEKGLLATLEFERHTTTTFVGGAEVQASYEVMREGARRVTINGSVGYERWFGMSGYGLKAALANNTALPAELGGPNPLGPGLTASIGAAANVSEGVTLTATYRVGYDLQQNVFRQEGRVGAQVRF